MAFCLRDLVELRQTDREGLGVCSQVPEVPARPARAFTFTQLEKQALLDSTVLCFRLGPSSSTASEDNRYE